MSAKRKTMRDDIAESRVETRNARRRKLKEKDLVRPDPLLSALSWDCASLIFDYLELRDLARCQQVCQSWKRFVERWMVVRGYYLHLPKGWRPDFGIANNMEQKVVVMKAAFVNHARCSKIASGRASRARAIKNAESLQVHGDFVAWVKENKLFGQRLGFQADGSPYPTRCWDLGRSCDIAGDTIVHVSSGGYVVARVRNDTTFLDRIVSMTTGRHLWRRACEPGEAYTRWPEIRGIGATRLYSVVLEEGSTDQAYILVHELITGALLCRSHVKDYPRIWSPRPNFCVRRIGNREVLVAFSVAPIHASPESSYHVPHGERELEGFLVINPEDGRTLQRFDAPFRHDAGPRGFEDGVESCMMPWTEDEGVFTVSCRYMTETAWVFKVDWFSDHADGTFHKIGTSIMTKDRAVGNPDQEVLNPQIDPFNNICLDVARGYSVPRITAMEACRQSDMNGQADTPRHAGVQVDRWFRDGKKTIITRPRKCYEGLGRRRTLLWLPLWRSTRYTLRSAGAKRLIVQPDQMSIDDENHVHTLFDFEFRRPDGLNLCQDQP